MLDDLPALVRAVEKITQAAARTDGALAEAKKRYRKDFGVRTLAEAEALLRKVEQEEREVAARYVRKKKAFVRRHRERLKEVGYRGDV